MSLGQRGELTGTRLGSFQLGRLLGAGGFGEVYLGVPDVGEPRAIKVLTSPELLDSFRREAQILAQLSHPNIARFQFADFSGDHPFLGLEVLDESLAQRGIVAPGEALAICTGVLEGLAYAHQEGVAHLDLKPENVLFAGSTPKIIDFGLAKALADAGKSLANSLTVAAGGRGTLAYMSPEQREGETGDARSDVYSFGLVLCKMLTGKLPQAGDSLRDLMPGSPPNWAERLFLRCYCRREKRFADAREALAALRAAVRPPAGEVVRPPLAKSEAARVSSRGPTRVSSFLVAGVGEPKAKSGRGIWSRATAIEWLRVGWSPARTRVACVLVALALGRLGLVADQGPSALDGETLGELQKYQWVRLHDTTPPADGEDTQSGDSTSKLPAVAVVPDQDPLERPYKDPTIGTATGALKVGTDDPYVFLDTQPWTPTQKERWATRFKSHVKFVRERAAQQRHAQERRQAELTAHAKSLSSLPPVVRDVVRGIYQGGAGLLSLGLRPFSSSLADTLNRQLRNEERVYEMASSGDWAPDWLQRLARSPLFLPVFLFSLYLITRVIQSRRKARVSTTVKGSE